MGIKFMLGGGVAAAALLAGTANAATINLIDEGGVAGSAAQQGFNIAAAYWGSVLSNNVTINLGVSYAALGAGIIGSTGSTAQDYTIAQWEQRVNATKSNSATDTNIVLPTLSTGAANASGAVALITSGPQTTAGTNLLGVNTASTARRYDNDTTGANATNNKILYLNSSNIKAIGGTVTYAPTNTQQFDGHVQFSSNFAFDFNPTDGLTPNTFDFIGVAIHEIGHALGFVSGVDYYDYFGTNGPGHTAGLTVNLNRTSVFSALDMFRYSNDPTNLVAGNGAVLDASVGVASYFSTDGGLTNRGLFATGSYNGDGDQASHWKDATGANACGPQIGIMDPTFCYAQQGVVTALDLAAFDAIGWNLAAGARGANYSASTSQIYAAYVASVPEPASWALMIAGFGLVGGAMRRRATTVTVAA